MIATAMKPQLDATNGIRITRGDGSQYFQTARDTPANIATNGPPVETIINAIIAMSPEQRNELQSQLANAEL